MKKRLLLNLLLFAAFFANGVDFSLSRMSVWPQNYQDSYRDGVLSRTAAMKRVCIYKWMPLKSGAGILVIQVKYTLTPGASAGLSLNYRTAKGRNGNAGLASFKLPEGTGKETEMFFYADIPSDAEIVQIVLGLSHGDASLKLSKWSAEAVSDRVALPGKCRYFYQSSTGKIASVQTAVEIAADDRALEFRFLLDEPEPELVKAAVEKRDGPIWKDDCAELFIYNPERKNMFQFILNTRGTQFDAELKQAQDGDPWKAHVSWNGKWEGTAEKTVTGYAVTFRIPYSALGYSSGQPKKLLVNFARERKANNEDSMWNAVSGNFNELDNFAELDLKKKIIIRCRKQEKADYLPVRKRTAGLELLSKKEKGGYWTGSWNLGAYLNYYPATFRKKYNEESFAPYRRQYLETLAKNGIAGPGFPWIERKIGTRPLLELNEKYGMTFPYRILGSRIHARAGRKYHAPLFDGKHTDPSDPAYIRATVDIIKEAGSKYREPGYRKLISLGHGIDEPTNCISALYSRTVHPEFKPEHDRVDQEIKANYGFSKFGLPDLRGKPDRNSQFRRIAFWRWWNDRFAVYLKQTSEQFRKELPGVPYLAVNRNNCGSICCVDAALFSPDAEVFGTDPYPTSSKAFGGIGRAIYHTGFSVRLLRDLASRSRICAMPQMFIYHSGSPTPEYVREWTSQALKNGAEVFFWYDEGPANITIPESYAEMLRLGKLISRMNKLPIPTETRTAILYSDADRWGLDDSQGHPYYCVYALLGEKLGANFRFVSPTGLKNGIHTLNGIRVLYIPRMRYAQPEDVKIILDFVRNGGTLVVFDPNVWTYHYDGTEVAERGELIPDLKARTTGVSSLVYKGKKAPVGKSHAIAPDAALPWSYDFHEGFTGKTLASYPDGKPAIMERNIGKGKIIVSACQPFGYSSVVLAPGGWLDFFRGICISAGEKTDLPIWNLVLPAK